MSPHDHHLLSISVNLAMQLLFYLKVLGAVYVLGVEATQLPLAFPPRSASVSCAKEPHAAWDALPNQDDTCNLIFDTVGNLLKHWSNDYYPNGHNVVPAIISPGTLLFHGRTDSEPPLGREWLSFDSDFSIVYTSRPPATEETLLTYIATRELRLIYFDGSSAVKRPSGTMDAQDIVLYGHVTDRWDVPSEDRRIQNLCTWGQQYNLDGFLRMNIDFEIAYCNFSSGLKLVTRIPVLPFAFRVDGSRPSQPPPGWRGSLLDDYAVVTAYLQASSWHNFIPLPGVRLEYSRMLSLYDPKYKSLVESRKGFAFRGQHRLLNMSREDAVSFQDGLHRALMRPDDQRGSGVDWGHLIRHITERHVGRLGFLDYLLRSVGVDIESAQLKSTENLNTSSVVRDVRMQVLTMLSPYLSRASVPSSASYSPLTNLSWLAPAMEHCSSTYTSHLPTSLFTPEESMLKTSIDHTVGQICRTLGILWISAFDAESIVSEDERLYLLTTWKGEVRRLKNWLGWAQWFKCDPACAPDELCLAPSLPMHGVRDHMTPFCLSRRNWEVIDQASDIDPNASSWLTGF